jgi:hypothetical protein
MDLGESGLDEVAAAAARLGSGISTFQGIVKAILRTTDGCFGGR